MPLLRFLPPEDPRIRATVLAIADELTEDGLVLRYRTEETDDGLSGEEGTFTICSFWLVSALIEIGELDRGRRLCERLLSLASPLELYAEELDPHSGRHLGNFPQAFTHLALVNAVMHVIRAEEAEQQTATDVHGNPVTRPAAAATAIRPTTSPWAWPERAGRRRRGRARYTPAPAAGTGSRRPRQPSEMPMRPVQPAQDGR